MAREGRFGRANRTAPNLTNTLIAIAREYQAQRSENIMSAWMKGGTFEGKKATDEVVLAFWTQRMKGVSKDDPLFDTYQNAVTQLTYQIAESKMTAAYATGPKDEAADKKMIAFYLGWAKKVPKDSEFYRVLQRDAGQYVREYAARAKVSTRQRDEERYTAQQDATRQKMEAGGEYLYATLKRMAQSGYAGGLIPAAIAAPGSGSDLFDFDPNDPNIMLKLIASIAPAKVSTGGGKGEEASLVSYKGNPDVLFHDDDGKGVTGQDILNQFSKLSPGYKAGQPFNGDVVSGALDRLMRGLDERIARAKATGHMTDVSNLLKAKDGFSTLRRQVHAYPVQKEYLEARTDYEAVMGDKSISPQAKLKAWQKYSGILVGLSEDERIEADDNMRVRLMAEVNGDAGVPTLYESFTGLSNAQFDTSSAKDAVLNFAAVEHFQEQVDLVNASAASPNTDPNKAVWTYGTTNEAGQFVPEAGGREIGAATMSDASAGGVSGQTVVIPDALGGAPLTVLVTAVPIYGRATDHNGDDITPSSNQPIAYAYDIPNGAGTTTTYGFQTKSGFVFSADPPWDDGLKLDGRSVNGVKRLELDMSPLVQKAYEVAGKDDGVDPVTGQAYRSLDLRHNSADGDPLSQMGFKIAGAKAASGTGAGTAGKLYFDPALAAWSSDTRDKLGVGAIDPQTDFRSLTLATLMANEDGRRIITNLDANPAFKRQLESDAYAYAGVQIDAKTGAPIPGTGDPGKLTQAQTQQAIASRSTSGMDYLFGVRDMWSRETTGSPYQSKAAATGFSHDTGGKLATDMLQGTQFSALGGAFAKGTNNLDRAKFSEQTGFQIKPVKALTVPGFKDAMKVVTSQNTQVSAAPVASGTSYQPPAQTQTSGVIPGQTQNTGGGGGGGSSSAPKPPKTDPYAGAPGSRFG